MALTEIKQIDKIEIVGFGHLQVREATTIFRDGVEVAKTYHRWAFPPGSDVSAMPENVQAIAKATWTPELVAAYQEHMAAQQVKMGVQP